MKFTRPLAFALPVAAGLWALSQAPAPPGPLSRYVPQGALLVVEARDFGALVRGWNASAEKRSWLAGANYRSFSRSRLFYRLADAQKEFAAVAGLNPDMALVEAVAGAESVLALYDIGELEFLYITRLAEARALETALWQSRARFETRSSAGRTYFVRIGRLGRTAAFAAADGRLLLSTREDAIAGALALMAGRTPAPPVDQEAWYAAAVRRSPQPGDLRLVLNLPRLAAAPHFRSYWIQRNAAELRQYSSAVSDLRFGPHEVREERFLLRGAAGQPRPGKAVAELLPLAPSTAGFYRAWLENDPAAIAEILERRVLAPRPGEAAASPLAPRLSLEAADAGSGGGLETRIDQPPPPADVPRFLAAALAAVIGRAGPEAVMVVETSRVTPQGVFVARDTAVAVLGAAGWPAEETRAAVQAAVGGLYTTGGLGMEWIERRFGGQVYHELSGLAGIALATAGRRLVVANSAAAMEPVLAGMPSAAPAAAGVYEAVYRHTRELPFYTRTMSLIDHGAEGGEREASMEEDTAAREPYLFSENIASLGEALSRVDSVSVSAADAGDGVRQVVIYRRAK